MHIIQTELTSLVVWHHLCVSISILSRVIKKKSWWPWMTLPEVTDDVRIDLSRIFAYDFDRVSPVKYNSVIRVPLRSIVPEIFAKKTFYGKNVCNFLDIFIITQKVFKISTLNFVYPINCIISRECIDNFLIISKLRLLYMFKEELLVFQNFEKKNLNFEISR